MYKTKLLSVSGLCFIIFLLSFDGLKSKQKLPDDIFMNCAKINKQLMSGNNQLKLKPHIQGLVSMGYVAGILRQKGKDGKPSDGIGSVAEDLDDVFSKPEIFSGVVFNFAWKELEPEQGKLNTKLLDEQLKRVRDYNDQYPDMPLMVRLRVSCGIAAPDWAKKIDGDPVHIIDPKGNYLNIGRFWTEKYRNAWRSFQNRLAAVYDNEPLIADVTVTSGMTNSDENMNLATHPYALENLHAAETRDYIASEHNWHDYQTHERAVRNHKYLYIRNAFPELNASPPADAVGSITYQEMIRLYKAGKLNENQLDCFIAPRPAEELYDVVSDPYQLQNLAEKPEYTNALNEMRKLLDNWIVEFDDKIPEIPTPDRFDRWTGERID